MLSRRIARAPALRTATRRLPVIQSRSFFPLSHTPSREILDEKYPDNPKLTDAEDPLLNGGYVNPPRVKRQHRDPHGDWWDKQERRNFGEPVHEDHDILGLFSPYQYTWLDSDRKALAQVGLFVATFLGLCWVISKVYPDQPAYPREFEDGLERELGGPGAPRARIAGDPEPFADLEAEEVD